MNPKDFIKILKRVIKDEVRAVIKEELKVLKPSINEYSGKTAKTSKDVLRHRPIPKTGQIGIQGILQETANEIRNGTSPTIEMDPTDEWPDINPSGVLQAEDAQGFATMNSMQEVQEEAPYQLTGTGTDQFVKDYSNTLAKSLEITSGKK
tara:strand:- start:1061 stop:1510 length:450 start_codon:yes stop_codon:yes gene_type:complete